MSDRDSVLAHLVDIFESIETDLLLPLRTHEVENRGGFLSISRQVFCYIDYLGDISSNGKGSRTDKAVKYMNRYFAQVNTKYKDKCDLLYHMWRQGTVHEYDLKIFVLNSGHVRLRWGANNTSTPHNRRWHLECMCLEKKPGQYHWFINLFELVEDLKDSIVQLIRDLESDTKYLARVQKNYKRLSTEIDLDRDKRRSKQATMIIDAAAGVINEHRSVTREFQNSKDREEYVRAWNP